MTPTSLSPTASAASRLGAPLLVIVLHVGVLLCPTLAQPVCGDCDGNATLNILDALLAAQFSTAIGTPTPVQQVTCDVNASTFISVIDALLMAQRAAGLPIMYFCPGVGNAPPTAANCTNTATMADIPITYLLSDPESNPCSITVEYSTNSGTTFVGTCTQGPGSDGITGLTSSVMGINHTFVWDSIADLGLVNVTNVVVRVLPRDMQNGFSCQTMQFTVANLPGAVPPTANNCTATPPLCGGMVDVDYTLIDPDSATVNITIEYSTNGGTTFTMPLAQGPGSEGTAALSASAAGVPHLFVWDAAVNLPAAQHNNLRIRITPNDPAAGTSCTTGVFALDLRAPPAIPGIDAGTYGMPSTGIVDVWVVADETGMPIAGASVMIGTAPNNPFTGNFGTTSAAGHIRFCDPALSGPNIVTGGATGRQYMTFYGTTANQVVLSLKPVEVYPPVTVVSGQLTGFTPMGCGVTPPVGAGLVIPTVQATDLITGFFGFVVGTEDCWQSGTAGNLVMPGNVYLPAQNPGPFCIGAALAEHRYRLAPASGTQQRFVGMFGHIPSSLLLSGTPTIPQLIQGFDFKDFHITAGFTPTGASQSLNIAKTGNLTENVMVTVGVPPHNQLDVFAVVAGDLSGSNGDGPLAIMGANLADFMALAGGPQSLGLTTTPAASTGGSVGYISMAAALFITTTTPPAGLESALTAVLDRTGNITGSGGSATINTYFNLPTLTPPGSLPGTFMVSDPSLAAPNDVDLVIHRFERTIEDAGSSLAPCAGTTMPTRTTIYWEIITDGGITSVTMPMLPGTFPRAAAAGMIDVGATAETDTLNWFAAFLGIGGTGLPSAPPFSFNQFVIIDLPEGITHLSGNATTL